MGQVQNVLQLVPQVIGVEHGHLSHFAQPVAAHGHDVGKGAHEDMGVTLEGGNAADALLIAPVQTVSAAGLFHTRDREIGCEFRGAQAGSCPRPPSAVGCGEGLVQIDVHHIHSVVGGACDSGLGVHIGTVTIDIAAFIVDHIDDGADFPVGHSVLELEPEDFLLFFGQLADRFQDQRMRLVAFGDILDRPAVPVERQ